MLVAGVKDAHLKAALKFHLIMQDRYELNLIMTPQRSKPVYRG